MAGALIQHLISVGNKSGAIPAAPHGLKDLKSAIQGIPFGVDVPGMSAVMSAANMIEGLADLVKQLGSLSALGEFKNILGSLQDVGIDDITKADPEALLSALQRTAGAADQLKGAVGGATALISSLGKFGGR